MCHRFFEVKIGGIVVVGDKVSVGDRVIGEVAGFDVTHMPNHMNIVVKAKERTKLGVKLGEKVVISA